MGGSNNRKRLPEDVRNLMSKKIAEREQGEVLWGGPVEEGVTQSLLGQYLVCEERFYLKTIRGLSFNEGFVGRLEYGNMWHECEEDMDNWSDRLFA